MVGLIEGNRTLSQQSSLFETPASRVSDALHEPARLSFDALLEGPTLTARILAAKVDRYARDLAGHREQAEFLDLRTDCRQALRGIPEDPRTRRMISA